MSDYLAQRLGELGISDEWNLAEVPDDSPRGKRNFPIFQPDGHGNIRINYLGLDGQPVRYEKGQNRKETLYYVTRLKEPKENEPKYKNPYGAPAFPFLTPRLVKAYQEGTEIETLYLTEGQFKVAKGDLHGLWIAGITGVWGWREKKVRLREDLREIVNRCKVQRLVLLFDGDCREIRPGAADKDLAKRLWTTFGSCANSFREIGLAMGLKVSLAHVAESQPKGLDDLLVSLAENQIEAALKELAFLSSSEQEQGTYFWGRDLAEFGKAKLREYFRVSNVASFYEAYEDQLKLEPFTWQSWQYKYNEDKERPTRYYGTDIPDNNPYRWIGTKLYMAQKKPWPDGSFQENLVIWSKEAAERNHSKQVLHGAPSYLGFTVIPEHKHFTQVIGGYYNRYSPMIHQPQEGETKHTLAFLRHIFGDQLELGLDYLQLLYLQPKQRLPILCLVSRERKTGKTTFLNWLKLIYPAQMGIYQNQHATARFNSDWGGKLVIAFDEAKMKLDPLAIESFKMLNFARSFWSEEKQEAKHELPFFAKFIFCSNEETEFLPVDQAEDRFWIRKVPSLPKTEDVNLEGKLVSEIPAFLYLLDNRKMSSENNTRMWFTPQQIWTEALGAVKERSRSDLEQEIRDIIKEYILDFYPVAAEEVSTGPPIRLARKDLHQMLSAAGVRTTAPKIGRILKDWGTEQNPKNERYVRFAHFQDGAGTDQGARIIKDKGRFYIFEPTDFLSEFELVLIELKTETEETPKA